MLCLRQLFATDVTESILWMWCLHYSRIFSFWCLRKNKVNITMHKLGNVSLSSEVITCFPSATSSENYVIARQEKSWVLFSFEYRHLCRFGTQQPYWLSPSTTIFSHRFFQKCKFARLYPSFSSTEVVSWDMEWQSQKVVLLWFFKNLKTMVNQKFWH